MHDALLALLRGVDTPTVCTAVELAPGERGFGGFTRGTLLSSAPEAPAVVGYAVTARIAAQTPPQEPAETVRARRMDFEKART